MSTFTIPMVPEEFLGTVPDAVLSDEFLATLVANWAQSPSCPGKASLLDRALLYHLERTSTPDAVQAYQWVTHLVKMAHAAASGASQPGQPPVTVGYLGIGVLSRGDEIDLRIAPLFSGPLVERRVALTAFFTASQVFCAVEGAVPKAAGFSTMLRTILPQENQQIQQRLLVAGVVAALAFVVADTLVMVTGATARQYEMFDQAVADLEAGLPDGHVEVFVDLAKQGKEAEFKDLARMLLDRLTPGEIDAMWTGTVKRVGSGASKVA